MRSSAFIWDGNHDWPEDLRARIERFVEEERRSCSMEVVTAEYVWRMWGVKVPLGEIERVMVGMT